jgi:hypothetical protein
MEASSWNLPEFPSGHHRQGLERRAKSSDERDKLAVELRRDGSGLYQRRCPLGHDHVRTTNSSRQLREDAPPSPEQ